MASKLPSAVVIYPIIGKSKKIHKSSRFHFQFSRSLPPVSRALTQVGAYDPTLTGTPSVRVPCSSSVSVSSSLSESLPSWLSTLPPEELGKKGGIGDSTVDPLFSVAVGKVGGGGGGVSSVKKPSKQYWAAGTGYGHSGAAGEKWDVEAYLAAQKEQDRLKEDLLQVKGSSSKQMPASDGFFLLMHLCGMPEHGPVYWRRYQRLRTYIEVLLGWILFLVTAHK